MSDTNGWSVTTSYAPTGTMCLSSPDGPIDIVYNEHPLTADQLRAFAAECVRAAERLEGEPSD